MEAEVWAGGWAGAQAGAQAGTQAGAGSSRVTAPLPPAATAGSPLLPRSPPSRPHRSPLPTLIQNDYFKEDLPWQPDQKSGLGE